MSRPIIGITKSEREGKFSYFLTALAIWWAGGKPIALTPLHPKSEVRIQGLVLGGGKDIYPKYYNGNQIKPFYPYDHKRDEMEVTWLAKCENQNIPVLGICRGAQLMNVFRNGTLIFDIRKAFEKASYPSGFWGKVFFRKPIRIKHHTLLFKIIETNWTKVNSSHTQSIEKVGDNLIISSYEENTIIQSIEDPSLKFFLGVQFHPEYLIHSKPFRNLFNQFVQVSKEIK